MLIKQNMVFAAVWRGSRRCFFYQFVDRDKADAVVFDADDLAAFAGRTIRRFNIDRADQIVQDIR